MEAVPRLPMMCFYLKSSHENASFGPKLKQYIADVYREDPESYNNEVYQLEGLRSAAVRPAMDVTGCAALKRYFCQLKALQSRFPMNKGQPAAVTFAWRDLFANIVCTLADIRFEMVCVLYNIGALHCKLGSDETRTTPESMKSACTHFQSAAWAFQYLREHYPQPSGIDLSPEIMKLFQDICLAQAQECILEKSMLDNRKPSIVSAIGMQALIYYRNALFALVSSQTADGFQENVGSKICGVWIKYLSFKVAYMSCVMYLFQGMQSEELQNMGERVAFYQAACDKLQEAKKLSKGLPDIDAINETITYTNDIVEGKRKAAKNENEFIYHEQVPDKDLLGEPKPASLAKGIPVNFNDAEISGPDIFARLIPMGAHEASSMYSEEKAKLLRKIVDAVDAKDVQLNDFISSLQLDQLSALEQSECLPQEFIDRCALLSVKTDVIQNLVESMSNLSDLHVEVENMLADIREILQEEDKNEKDYQKVMGSRQPSIVSTELSREANKYLEAHHKANESNQTLQKAMTLHLANLKILVLSLDEIQNHVPSLHSIKDNVDHSTIAEMKMLLGKVNEMQNQRKIFVSTLRDAVNTDDITTQLLSRQEESLDHIFKQEIEKHNKQVGLIEQNLVAQENILKALTDAYAKYAPTRKLITDIVRKREASLTALMTSYDTYEDLLNKLLKGLEFYRKLSANVKKLHTRVKSTCKVQEEERSQLLATHTSKQVKASDAHFSSTLSTALPKEVTSSTPKLKDFLPYMKNRSSTYSSDSSAVDTSYNAQMYPPYIRPAPVGSDGTSDTTLSNYTDPSASNLTSYQMNSYKTYQYTGMEQYPDQSVTSQYMKTDLTSQNNSNMNYYQQYDTTKTSDYKTPVQQSDMQQPASQYYPTASSTNTIQYGQYGYNTNVDSNIQQVNIQTGQSEQYANQALRSYNTAYDNTSAMSNPQSYNTNITQMMDNMTISTNVPTANSFNSPSLTPPVPLQNSNVNSQVQPVPPSDTHTSNIYNNPSSIASSGSYYPNVYNQTNMPLPSTPSQTSNVYSSPNANQPIASQSNPNVYNTPDTNLSNVSPYHNMYDSSQGVSLQNQYTNVQQQSTYDPANTFNSSYAVNSVYDTLNNQYVMSPNSEQQSSFSTFQSGTVSMGTYVSQPNTEGLNQYSYNTPQNYGGQDTLSQSQYASYPHVSAAQATPIVESSATPPIESHTQNQNYQMNYALNQQSNYYNQETGAAAVIVQQQYPTQGTPQLDQNSAYPQQTNYYQNQTGYVYNPQTGAYEYNYNYQQTTSTTQQEIQSPYQNADDIQKGIYTSAGSYGTVQTSSESNVDPTNSTISNTQYYSVPYGYQNTVYSNVNNPENVNQGTTVTDQTNKSSSKESSLTYSAPYDTKTSTTNSNQGNGNIPSPSAVEPKETKKIIEEVPKSEPSTMDLLSGLDFTIDHKPLMPEIKVPAVSELVIRKVPSQEEKNPLENDVPSTDDDKTDERPQKRDIFSEPGLLNKFTQDAKSLQMFVDGFTKKTHSGITMLDSKWKKIQDAPAKEYSPKSIKIAKENLGKNASPDVLPYDDARVILKGFGDDDDYINASHVRRISPWAIPMIVSDLPIEENYTKFWHMVYQEKVSIIVCLLTEIELQGKFYGPMTKSHKLELGNDISVTLSDVKCNVNWTKRKLIVHYKNSQHKITHYQINVFPARIVSAPLVLLVDKVLKNHEANLERDPRSKALIHCSTGAGRSSLIVLLTMVVCQTRAGYINLKEILDSGFLYLCGTRTNVLEDTKYLVDIYRTVLFYVQGVLCSGTVMFNGEAVSLPSGASVPAQHIPSNPNRQSTDNFGKFSKESFEEMKQTAGLKSGDMKDPLSYLDPLWSLKKRKE